VADVRVEQGGTDGGRSCSIDEGVGMSAPGVGTWWPTHHVPPGGLATWTQPDGGSAQAEPLAPGTPVAIVADGGNGWSLVRRNDGLQAWVDGRQLVAGPPAAAAAAPVADPVPTAPPIAFAPLTLPPEPAARRHRGRLVLKAAMVVVSLGAGLASWLLLQDAGPSTAQAISVAMLVLSTILYGVALAGIRRPGRVRPVPELLRAGLAVAGVIAIRDLTRSTPELVLPVALAGLVLGLVEGAVDTVVKGSDGKRYGPGPMLPMLCSGLGLLGASAAALADVRVAVAIGQLLAILGAALGVGAAIGRAVRPSSGPKPVPAPAYGVGTVLAVVGAGAVAAIVLGGPTAVASPAQTSAFDGVYTGSYDVSSLPSTMEVTRNSARFEVQGTTLSGTVELAQTDRGDGELDIGLCSYTFGDLAAGAATAMSTSDGVTFRGTITLTTVVADLGTDCFDRSNVDGTLSSVPTDLEAVVTSAGMQLRMGDLATGQMSNITLTRDGQTPPPPPPIDDGSGGVTPATDDPFPKSIDEIPTTFIGNPDVPIPPASAAEGAIAIVMVLAGAGVISAAEAAATRGAIARGAVPADVIAELGRRGKLGDIGRITDVVAIQDKEAVWKSARDILNNPTSGRTVDPYQYREYVEHVERAVPWANWKEVAAALHADQYGHDTGGKVPMIGNDLFIHGPDTDAYKRITPHINTTYAKRAGVTPVSLHTPKWVVDHSGNRVDIGHALAGLRSDLGRQPGLARDVMREFNTHAGDTWQVFTGAWDASRKHGYPRPGFEYYPPDQKLGNDAGRWLSDFYRQPANANVPLSKATEQFFRSTHGIGHREAYY
jgi:hypothetical protein